MKPRGDAAELEQRRCRAVDRVMSGTPVAQVARDTGVTIQSLYRWIAAYRAAGDDGLAARPMPGRSPKLSPAQESELMRLLRRGPQANGYPFRRWEAWVIGSLIAREFEISYHPDHIRSLLGRIGGTTIRELNRRGWSED
jgi:putative transposase